jgi:alkylated DNA nucleotide flippase Atl1
VNGQELKELGIARASSNVRAAPWRAVARIRVLELIRRGETFTSEDITRDVGQPPHPNQVGALLSGFARAGLIVRVGMVNAKRTNQHAALIGEWRPTARAIVDARVEARVVAQRTLWE